MPAMVVVTPMMPVRATMFPVMLAIVLALFSQVVPVRALRLMMQAVPPIATIIVIAAIMAILVPVAMPARIIMGESRCCNVQEKCCQRCQQNYPQRSKSHVSDSRVQRDALCSAPSAYRYDGGPGLRRGALQNAPWSLRIVKAARR